MAVIAWWSGPRGFDFLDSGVYYLEYKYPEDVADTHTTYRLFARPFYLLVGESIAGFRYVSWLLLWASAAVLGVAWWRHLRMLYPAPVCLLGLPATVGLFMVVSGAAYTIKPAALTYNSLNLMAVAIVLGLLLEGSTRLVQRPADRTGIGAFVAAALLATIDFLIKPTTAAFLVATVVGYCVVSPAIPLAAKRRLAVMALAGALIGTIAMLLFVGGVAPLWERGSTLLQILQNDAYMRELNTRTVREFGEIGTFLWQDLRWVVAAFVGAAAVLWALRRNRDRQRRWAGGFALLVVVLWLHSVYAGALWRGSHTLYEQGIVARFYLGAALVATIAALVTVWVRPLDGAKRDAHRTWLKVLLWGIFVVTPFAGAYGSTTTVYLNGAIYAMCWLGVWLLGAAEIARRWRPIGIWPVVVAPIALLAVAQLHHGQIVMPYMNPKPLWEQTVPTTIGTQETTLLLDEPTSTVINETRRFLSAHGFQPGDDIFCFFNIPGLVYAVGGRSPVIPWYFGRIYGGNTVEELFMQRAGEERRRQAWLITQADVMPFREHLRRGGIDFPDGYEEIGALTNPQSGLPIQIWKPKTRD